jgi:hypothetical protein
MLSDIFTFWANFVNTMLPFAIIVMIVIALWVTTLAVKWKLDNPQYFDKN